MSQENVEIVRQFLKDRTAFLQGEGDSETFDEVRKAEFFRHRADGMEAAGFSE